MIVTADDLVDHYLELTDQVRSLEDNANSLMSEALGVAHNYGEWDRAQELFDHSREALGNALPLMKHRMAVLERVLAECKAVPD